MSIYEAYPRMVKGDAIARRSWRDIHYLFFSRGKVWAVHHTGRVQCYEHYFRARNLLDAEDWYVVTDVSPPQPPPKRAMARPATGAHRHDLSSRQAEMKSRWSARGWRVQD